MPGMEWIVLYIALGSFVGFMAGLLGVGGGGILVPLLTFIFTYQGMSAENVVHLALGTSLTCMIISSTASIRAHASRGAVVWRIVGGMAPGIMLGAFLVTQVAANVNSTLRRNLFCTVHGTGRGADVPQLATEAQPKADDRARPDGESAPESDLYRHSPQWAADFSPLPTWAIRMWR